MMNSIEYVYYNYYLKICKLFGYFYVNVLIIAKLIFQGDYLVKWKNYHTLSNTWEPEENLNALALR